MILINTICLCGSTRFMDQFHEANVELTKRGFSVITISMAMPKEGDADKGLKEILDLVHFNKILRADAIFVVHDDSGYVGFSTAREILWASMQGKSIFWQSAWRSWDEHANAITDGNDKSSFAVYIAKDRLATL